MTATTRTTATRTAITTKITATTTGYDHGHGHGHHGKKGKHHRLPQLPPAVPATLPVTCEQLAATLGAPAPAAAPAAAGQVQVATTAAAAVIAPAAAASGVPVPVPGPIPNTTITSTTTVPPGTLKVAGQDVPEHCLATGKMFERVSPVDGKTYAIAFEMRLPKTWNGRFWHQGNGGIDGSVATASGTFGGGPLTSALLQGFAVLSSDAGHTLAQGGPAFGVDPQARLDYGYQAVGKLTPMAKKLIELAYGKGPDRSYFGGCSNGGRHTLVAAARYAADYDGFLAGAPGYNLPIAALANIFGAQRYATVATGDPASPAGLETAFTAAERTTVANAVLARCDALDGLADGLVQDTGACQRRFSLFRHVPTCSGARDGSCLTLAQKIAIAPIFRGATLANGERFYAGFPYDSGLGGGGVPFWEFTAPLALDSGAVGIIFGVPPANPVGFNGPAFSLGGNIDALYATLYRHRRHVHRSRDDLHDPAQRHRYVGRAQPRRQDLGVPRRERPDLLGRGHRRVVRRRGAQQRRLCRQLRAFLPRARHGALFRRAGHRPVRPHQPARRLGGAGRCASPLDCHCARCGQRGGCER